MGYLQSLHEPALSLVPSELRAWANGTEVKYIEGLFNL